MGMLLVAATLLSLSPLVVTFLHVLVGLRWRANSLLGRLDTVLELCIRDKKNLRTRKNLENQLIELHYQVRGFASASKIQEMAEIHRKMPVSYTHLDVYKRQVVVGAVFWLDSPPAAPPFGPVIA